MRKKQEAIDLSKLTDKERGILDARNALQRECREFVKYPAGIYCLPIPTGEGKRWPALPTRWNIAGFIGNGTDYLCISIYQHNRTKCPGIPRGGGRWPVDSGASFFSGQE